MNEIELQVWAESQVQALMAAGVDAIDAGRSVNWVLSHLPPNADPNTYVLPADILWEDPASEAAVADARSDWYASEAIPARYKRLLDAVEMET